MNMEEFESYFDTLNFHFTSWNDILENEKIDIRSNNGEMLEQNVQLLPRQDVSLYGIIPKMEKRSFSTCKDCQHVFNPRDVLLHKNCTVRVKSQHTQHSKKKVKSKKKSPVPLPPLFPTGLEGVSPLEELNTTEIHQNSIFIVNVNELLPIDAVASPMSAKPSQLVEDVGNIPLPPTLNSNTSLKEPSTHDKTANSQDQAGSKSSSYTYSNFHTNSKCKRKKYSKSRESDTKSHSGPNEDNKSQHVRSIKYSNHTSDNDAVHGSEKSTSVDCNYSTQDNPQSIAVPVVYMPMSPVSPLQNINKEDLDCMDTPQQVLTPTDCSHQIYLTIPEQITVKMYKTRPKLGTYPSYGSRNIGGAIVISKQKLVNQRKDILSAINTKHIAHDILSNYNKSISHRINVVKAKTNKVNFRKSPFDKCQTNDLKHLRLSPDVNGFIIHADVPDGNDDQQNSMHNGKITMMNMK
ncbi:uncharacterized protein LOC123322080 [Coccinella septempunctata]|uniref:uncharacterized protein LOC123322080 n=1 Tax=Coccinella septempunctata TaxID=41139 RepID=UPI001D08C6DC|nr:uncharacterized protein LOC123322080 [Coccinella septempunctata]